MRISDWSSDVCSSDLSAPPAWLWDRYRERFASADPIPYFAMQPGRVYAYEELDGIAAKERDDFREDFLRAADFEHFLIFRVAEPGGCNIWVTVTRDRKSTRLNSSH